MPMTARILERRDQCSSAVFSRLRQDVWEELSGSVQELLDVVSAGGWCAQDGPVDAGVPEALQVVPFWWGV
jgi:hypothetical protein